MKFTVHKSDLLEKLAPAMGTVSNKNTIASIEGIEQLKADPAVLSYIQYYNVGETIHEKDLGNLGQQFARVYILADTKEELVNHINRIQDAISIKDTDGNEMYNLRFDTNRLYQ